MVKKFLNVLKKIQKDNKLETTGEALRIFINVADNTSFSDWSAENLDDTVLLMKADRNIREELGLKAPTKREKKRLMKLI